MSFIDQFLAWAVEGLLQSEEAQAYVQGRGVSRGQWERHRIGYVAGDYVADSSLDPGHSDVCSNWEKRSLHCDSCHFNRWATLWEEPNDDSPRIKHPGRRIAGGIVLPLTSYAGQAVGFQIRSMSGKSYDTFILNRHPEGFFFGIGPNLEVIWSSSEIWLVEGPFDALILERLLVPNVVALATGAVSPIQARFLRRFVRRVHLCLDLDPTGRKGVHSFFSQYGNHFDVRDHRYPKVKDKDKDLGDLWKTVGDERFIKLMEQTVREWQ